VLDAGAGALAVAVLGLPFLFLVPRIGFALLALSLVLAVLAARRRA
jgi:hypothetical protein